MGKATIKPGGSLSELGRERVIRMVTQSTGKLLADLCVCKAPNVTLIDQVLSLQDVNGCGDGIPVIVLVCSTCGRMQLVSGYEALPDDNRSTKYRTGINTAVSRTPDA